MSSYNLAAVSYDTGYDIADRSQTTVSCSNGKNGLMTRKQWKTQGEIPRFPYIGADAIPGWNSSNCGSCWRLEYDGKAITLLAIDHAGAGFNIVRGAMNDLTGGNAEQFGRVDATAARLLDSDCGM